MKRSMLLLVCAAITAFATKAKAEIPPNQVPPSIQKEVDGLRADGERHLVDLPPRRVRAGQAGP